MFWLVWTKTPRKAAQGRGYFNCPACGKRQPCDMSSMVNQTYLYGFIPIGNSGVIGPEFYRCLSCKREFQSDGVHGYDFGQHPQTQTWQCFKCKGDIPYERFDCPHCGQEFDFGQRRY